MLANNTAQTLALALVAAACALPSAWSQAAPPGTTLPATPSTDTGIVASAPLPEIKFNPPQVTCGGGQLTIRANSSNINSVLDAVHQCLGITIAVPGVSDLEPVFLQLGPGPANRVLTELLSMTDFDFVVLSASGQPEKIVKVELLSRTAEAVPGKLAAVQNADGLSPARLAWLAARNLGRGMPPKEQDPAAEPASRVAEADQGAEPDHKPTGADASDDKAVPAEGPAGVPPAAPEVTPAPAAPEASQPTEADKAFQNKITDMQHLFEQRKKLNESSPDPNTNTPPPNPTPSTN